MSDQDLLHLQRSFKSTKGAAITLADLLGIPKIIDAPKAVLWDKRDPALLWVFDPIVPDGRLGKLVLRLNMSKKSTTEAGQRARVIASFVTTAGLIPLSALLDAGNYVLVRGAL